jgi:hypothetical protein
MRIAAGLDFKVIAAAALGAKLIAVATYVSVA